MLNIFGCSASLIELRTIGSAIIQAYSHESIIAEKFEAMLVLSEANSRMKDFYDIYTLARMFHFKGVVLHESAK